MAQGQLKPVDQYDAWNKENNFIFVVFYRGSWCPFCQAYLKELQRLTPAVEAAGGKVFTVTSENISELPKMRAASGYTGETIVDPTNSLAKALKERNLINVAISDHKGYLEGMVQPAVLIGSINTGIFYKWAIVPATMNLGGAKDRPLLDEVWANVDAKMHNRAPPYTKIRQTSLSYGLKQKFFG